MHVKYLVYKSPLKQAHYDKKKTHMGKRVIDGNHFVQCPCYGLPRTRAKRALSVAVRLLRIEVCYVLKSLVRHAKPSKQCKYHNMTLTANDAAAYTPYEHPHFDRYLTQNFTN